MNPQVIVNGLLLGALYALIGLGFSLVWGVMNIINIAHGAFIMLGAYVAYWAFALAGIDPFLSIILAMLVLFVLAYVIQQYVINFVVRSGVFVTLILTFGLNIFLKNVALALWSGNYRTVRTDYSGEGLNIVGLVMPYNRIGIVVVTIVITFAFHRFLTRTKMGRTIMATALNKEAAQLVGVDIGRVYALTFGLAAALAGAAGAMMSTIYAVTPVLGDPFIGKAFVVATLGGLGTMVGAIIGGVILGLAETMGGAVFGSGYQDAIAFAVLIIVLIVRPEGIVGRQFFAEVGE